MLSSRSPRNALSSGLRLPRAFETHGDDEKDDEKDAEEDDEKDDAEDGEEDDE